MNIDIGVSAAVDSNRPQASVDRLQTMVEHINQMPLALRRRTRLSIDHAIGRIIIKVIDIETDTVIKEMPPVALQKIYRNIREQLDKIGTQVTNTIDV